MKHGDLITIVLKHRQNIDGTGLRLVHTTVFVWHHHRKPEIREKFEAAHDDRIDHKVSDLGVTWLHGHVLFNSPEALDLIRCAEEADGFEEVQRTVERDRERILEGGET